MLDEAWLEGIQFDSPYGRVTGLAGIGSQQVAFHLTTPSGEKYVLKTMYPHLAFAIRELPPDLTLRREYSVERLNRKLLHLVDNPLLDAMAQSYDDLYIGFVAALHEQGVTGLLQTMGSPRAIESSIFLLQTPGMKRRLQDMASLKHGSGSVEDTPPSMKLPLQDMSPPKGEGRSRRRILVNRGVFDYRSRIVQQARKNLRDIELLPQISPEMQPDKLPENPLYTWGAAIMDGFFTDEELPQVTAFLTEHFGPLPQHPLAKTFTQQVMQLAYLLEQAEQKNVFRFVQLCNMVGLLPDVTEILELPGEAYLERGQYREALTIFNKSLSLDDQDVKALTFRGETYRRMEHYEEALADLNRAINLDPQKAEAITYRGETYVNIGRFEEALADFDQAIILDPQNIEALANRGERYSVLGRYQEALDDLNRALSLNEQNPDLAQNPDLILMRAITYRQMGRNQESLADLDQVIDLTVVSPNVEALVNRALIYAEDGQYMKALDDLHEAILIYDKDASIFTIRGKIYVELERYEEALADFDYALTINEQDIDTISSRGETYRIMGRYHEALADFEHALTLDPQNAEIISRRDMVRHQIEHQE